MAKVVMEEVRAGKFSSIGPLISGPGAEFEGGNFDFLLANDMDNKAG
ncbi:hypothetical protein [Microbulbifer rhizosphaerae]|uniref:Uncharacterized protein n=1 Tax=Microbulbifer rhizosphaerae TaxID=1562603 RepID=A0A7W4WBI1_9GAMM|nr:hypothetical protein [Microbulbifer rhizosphaerae]MBB3061218.1 hypothetical protein [Microbulbifer rhizosphaerae]